MSGIASMLAGTVRGLGSLKVVMATGLYKTAAGVVGARVLKENNEPLRQYLTIHLRSGRAAQNALLGIEDTVEHGTADDLSRGPTKRSALYLAARNSVEYERLFGEGTNQALSAVPWNPVPPGRPDKWGRALDELRFGLGPDESEILELHHARGLSVDELAFLLGAPKDEIAKRLEAGAAYAKLLLEDVFSGAALPKLEDVLRDAYAIMPATPEDMAATKVALVPLPPGTVIGDRYEIETRIGGGEFAFVYRARDVRVPGHVVALKLLHRVARTPAAREGALRELSLIASAFHPSLVHFKEHGWFEDRLWFVMPFYVGESLLERIEKGPLPLGEALEHFERLARGLAALHAAGIRHQDVKPENIHLVKLHTGSDAARPEILPILLDLGVATPSGEMALAGTPMYFPPEVAARIFDEKCDVPLTPKADVFALALSLLHAIEEADLSDLSENDVDAFLKKRAHRSPRGPQVYKHLKEPFARWLSHDPNQRPTAGQLADEIAELRGVKKSASNSVAPKALRGAIMALAMSSLFAASIFLADSPPRPIAPPDTSAREITLQHRLDTEAERNARLERELERLRRRELGLDEERVEATSEPVPGG
jgi:serine/threonine protein kinase